MTMEFPVYGKKAAPYLETPPAAAAPRHPLARPRARSLTGSYHCVERSDGSLFIRIDVPGVQNLSYSYFHSDPLENVVSIHVVDFYSSLGFGYEYFICIRVCSTDRDYEWFISVPQALRTDLIHFTITDGIFRMSMPNTTGTLHFLNVPTPGPVNELIRRSHVAEGLHDCMPYVAYLPRPDENTDMPDLAGGEVYPQRIRGTGGVCTFEQTLGLYGTMLKITFDAPGANAGNEYQLHINSTSPNMGWVEIRCDDGVVPRRVYSVAFATTCGCCILDRPNMEVRNGVVTITTAYLRS